jgi:hypothetical protein
VYALFADEIKVLTSHKKDDPIFNYLAIFVLALFLTEFLVSIICKHGYFNSFFFYLDIIATVTLLFDIDIVKVALFQ